VLNPKSAKQSTSRRAEGAEKRRRTGKTGARIGRARFGEVYAKLTDYKGPAGCLETAAAGGLRK
jgi:hypothetical protein